MMTRRFRGYIGCATVLAACQMSAVAPAMAQTQPLELAGSVKSVYLRSRAATGEGYALNLNRLRVEAMGDLAAGIALDLQYDNELLLGSYLETGEFQALKDRSSAQYWRADANYVERGEVYGRHRLYRAAVTLTRGKVDLKLGRQRIAWGTGRFWSPLDILNPASPLAIEREERVGVDAALLEAKLGPLSRASLVYAPPSDNGSASRALQWHGNAVGVDASLVLGRLRGFDVVGTDIASQIGDVGVRAEVARLNPADGRPGFNRWMAGADYAFANGLTLSAELYYNGAGSRNPAGYDIEGLRSGRVASLATRYAGLYASYEITPLLKWVNYVVLNVDDHSHAIDSRLVWSAGPATDLTIGVQHFTGTVGREFAASHNAVQVQLQWFFR